MLRVYCFGPNSQAGNLDIELNNYASRFTDGGNVKGGGRQGSKEMKASVV